MRTTPQVKMGWLRVICAAAAVPLFLAACAPTSQVEDVPTPPSRPADTAGGPSEASKRLAAFYAAREARLIAQGKLREDFAPADAPFDADDLVRNFRRVALYDEYRSDTPGLVAEQTLSQLRRWHKPLQIGIHFGATVSEAQKRKDLAEVRSFARRLGAITGLQVNFTSLKNANFVVLFLDRDETRSQPQVLAEDITWMNAEVVRGIQTVPDDIYCIAYGLTSDRPPLGYVGAVILVRSEHPPRLRKSCIHEEMTQALGLANDAPGVRPSVFNDDEEFAYLTRHDEILLKMLYDPRLRDGMTPASQTPILREVAEDATRRNQS